MGGGSWSYIVNVSTLQKMNMAPQQATEWGVLLEHSKQMPYFTDLRLVFKALNNRQAEFNWLITDLECNFYPPELRSYLDLDQPAIWLSGTELTRIVEQYEIQFEWAVLSGFPHHVILDLDNLELEPYADGNAAIWSTEAKIQHPLAEVEIICWDSSALLLRARDIDLVRRFRDFFTDAVDLDLYNQAQQKKHSRNWLRR
jgi:hypothetical protein